MAWSIVGVGGAVTAGTGTASITLTEPASVASGDLLVACISYRGTNAFTLPSGWNVVSLQQSSGNTSTTTTSSIASGVMAYIVRGGSAPDLAFTRTAASADVALGRIVAYRGGHSSPYDTGNASTPVSNNTATFVTAGVTTAEANELLVAMLAGADNVTTSGFFATDPSGSSGASDTTTAPTVGSWIERADSGTNTGADTALAIADAVKSTAGSTGLIGATASASSRHVFIVGAFKIASTGISATLSVTEANDTVAGTATNAIVGSLSKTEASDTVSGTATNAIVAVLSVTEGNDTLSATGGSPELSATLSVTEADDTVSGTATNAIVAILSSTEAGDTLSSEADSGIEEKPLLHTGLPVFGEDPFLSSDGRHVFRLIERTGLAQDGDVAFDLPEAVDDGGIDAVLAVTEQDDTLTATATNAIVAVASITEAADTLSATATNAIVAVLSVTEGSDTLSSTATNAIVAVLGVTEEDDTLTGAIDTSDETSAVLAVTEADDTVSATATVSIQALLATTESDDAIAVSATVAIAAVLAVTEANDSVSATGTLGITAVLTVTEGADTLSAIAVHGTGFVQPDAENLHRVVARDRNHLVEERTRVHEVVRDRTHSVEARDRVHRTVRVRDHAI